MPIREYECLRCRHITESLKERQVIKCERCDSMAERVKFSVPADTGWRYPTSK